MADTTTESIRNVALVGHGATGKTTLADLLLFKSGVASRAGSVDDGSSLLDTDDEEKARNSSTTSSIIHFDHAGKLVQLIDTPGFPDFSGQMFGALAAVETAVIVISAGAGIEVNTRRAFAAAGAAGLGRMILINKCDMDNVEFADLVGEIQEVFGHGCVPLNVPVGIGGEFSGVVSTLEIPDEVPDGVEMDLVEVHQSLMDAIVEADEELMERYLEGETLSQAELSLGVMAAIASGTLIPIFCSSSKTDVGVDEFLDAMVDCSLAVSDVSRTATCGGEDVVVDSAGDDLVAQVFKTRIDPFVSKMSFIRVFSGTLKKDSNLHVSRLGKPVKMGQLLSVNGAEQATVDQAVSGQIVALVKMDDLRVSDTLTANAGTELPVIEFPRPMVGLAVEPKSQADQTKISGALQKIEDEDSTFRVERQAQTKEMVMMGMSELHLQVIENRMASRDRVEVVTRAPKIPYRETVSGSAEGSYRHKKQTGGAGQFAEVHFKVQSLTRDLGEPDEFFIKANFENLRSFHYDDDLNYSFIDRVTGGSVPNNFIPAVEKGVRERMEQGVIAGFQVQDCTCELYFGKDHPVDSNETAFKTAANRCFREVFLQASPVLLEPIVKLEITVPDAFLGDITSDLNTRRGRMEGMDNAGGGFQVVLAKVPLAEVTTYSRSLSSMTGGEGSYSYEFSHYEQVPPQEQSKIVAAAAKRSDDDGGESG
jgi:elongation factor G